MRRSGWFTGIAMMIISLLLVTACGNANQPASSQSKPKPIKIGVAVPTESNNTVLTWYNAIKAKGKALGMEVIGIDSQLNPTKQVGDIDSLLTQGADVIMVWPLDPATLKPAIDRAKGKNVPVMGIDFNVKSGGPDFGLTHQVILGREQAAVKVAELFSKMFPNGAEVAGIGMAAPVPGNVFVMEKYHSEVDKYTQLKWIGQQNNPTDNISGAEPLMANLLTKNPKLQAVFTYNDDSAIGAAQAVTNNNKQLYSPQNPSGVLIVGFNAEKSGIDAIKLGKQYATFNLNPVKAGVSMVDAAYKLLSEKAAPEKIGRETVIEAPMVTMENMNSFVSWDDELKQIGTASPGK